ncbi:MAG: hypothetical protein WCA89_16715 [Terracidiphilus sp.]|jgi:glutamate-1-semialdehyde 2,1-aminomutase
MVQNIGEGAFRAQVNAIGDGNPLKVMREAGMRKHMIEEMRAAFSAHGIVTQVGSRIYTGLADTDAVFDDASNRFDDVLKLA